MNHKKSTENEELIRSIVIERLRAMPQNVKIALGSNGTFLSKDELIREVDNNTDVGKKIIMIQFEYMKALKKGIL